MKLKNQKSFFPSSRSKRFAARSGFIILFGSKNIIRMTGSSSDAACPKCNNNGSIVGKTAQPWFTLFFLPVFPMGSKQHFTECTKCKAQFAMTVEDLTRRIKGAEAGKTQFAIQMYNSLRQSPANCITLNELMTFYASMNEFDQAISAARDFPEALNNSEQCQFTLGRVHIAADHYPQAIECFDAALARNPNYADAHYYKAITYFEMKPPNLEQAQISARAARNNDHPNAGELLKLIEQKQRDSQT